MGLMDWFTKPSDKKPIVKGYTFGWNILSYDLSYETYFKYYDLNPFIFMCINKRSNDAFSKWFDITRWWKTLYPLDFEELIKYSTAWTPKEFIKRLVRDYDITGNAYVYIVKNEKGTKPIWVQILDPRYIKPVADKTGKLLWYVQNLYWIKVFLPDEVFHIKNDNDITNEIVGKSRMTSLFVDVETDQEAKDSNLAFFKNNQTPSSLILLDPEFEVDETDQTKIRAKIKQMFEWGQYIWGKNKHRSMMAQWIKDVIKIQDKISDWEFLWIRNFTLDLVSAVYEVPKSILWFTENANYSNGLNQYDIYWDNIEALEKKFGDFLTSILQVFDNRYQFLPKRDNLRKLMLKSDIAWSLYKDKQLLTLNEAREIIDYKPVKDWEKFNSVPAPIINQNPNPKKK